MGTVNQKYLKDENDNTISPVTSVDSVYDRNGDNVGGYCTNWYHTSIHKC